MLWYCKAVDFMSMLGELWYGNINPSEKREISWTDDKASGVSYFNT